MAIRLPGRSPIRLTSFCASPAVRTPAGRVPGIRMAPRVRSRQPIARTTAPRVDRRDAVALAHHAHAVAAVAVEPDAGDVGAGDEVDVAVDRLLEEALGVLGAGQLLLEVVQAEAGVDALQEDAARLGLAVERAGPAPRRRRARRAPPRARPGRRRPPPRRSAAGGVRAPSGLPLRAAAGRRSASSIGADDPRAAAALGHLVERHAQPASRGSPCSARCRSRPGSAPCRRGCGT